MAYFVGLLALLVIVFTTLSGNVFSPTESLNSLKARILEFVDPKTDKEIAIDGLTSNVDSIIALLGETVPNILKSANISEKDKTNLKKIIETASATKVTASQVQALESKNGGIFQSIVNSAANLISPNATNNGGSPNPTYIPPQCKLVCNK